MKEGLAARVSRIVSGSINGLVGALENMAPEIVMEEAIREVDGAVEEVRAELGRLTANRHLSTTRLDQERARHTELSGQIEIAVKEARDDLAEAAISKQMDIEAQIPVLENAITDYSSKEKELESYLVALQAKRREMVEELKAFRASRNVTAIEGTTGNNGVESKVASASQAFERITGSNLGEKIDPRLGELEELSRNNRIRERLAAIKAGTGK